MWAYFETTEYNRSWIMKRTKIKRLTDRDIRCIYTMNRLGSDLQAQRNSLLSLPDILNTS
ncbi:hypothetical protein POJ06DRAFT_258544 [Lipomyces tetrasporus]|uniref:Uncharacterized protein n=1 Tax=Lipomyces tetrasporus TaxID=54092 RepID=A0AAD7QMU4_9ASCO|nr:uncharacterized protein POJ06DRAFT_258544 [Lipomyces tetrasporus]KAJ8098098.1 hypothetical protein POJ06DRAFT_258544 [Lipomyces tetrasporus]